jgi:hypothetical protein
MAGVFLRQGDALVPMTEAPYVAEAVLQELLERYPNLLTGADPDAGPAWLLIQREAAVALGSGAGPRGFLDHLFVDSAGVPTLVEVKRSSDTRVRREVVGQMLDYAANAASYWQGDTLRSLFEARCSAAGEAPDDVLRSAFDDVEDAAEYWAAVRTNLAAGRLRLVFVADEIPPELRRIVEFLNGQMTQTEVLAIEVKQYRDSTGTHETLVPRVLGQTEAARQVKRSGREWDRESILSELTERGGAPFADVVERMFSWVDARGDLQPSFGSGTKDGSFSAGYWDKHRYLWPFVLYTYGRVEVNFGPMSRRRPFDDPNLREELRTRLLAIQGVDLPPVAEAKRPSIQVSSLLGQGVEIFTATMDWAYEQANGAASGS